MPRPGPRPYECVRRAWHSDRHHPIRGSVIREIFRMVSEVHCSSTRKNREWLEKLPIVVLKAEEIIYSKANSEAEYSDLKTLWERVNDAINTIIRRDESTETGELLQPCIEAALHLGCTPRRLSRSQRYNCPRYYYLTPETSEATSVPGCNSNASACGTLTTNSHLFFHYSQYSNSLHSCLVSESRSFQRRNSNVSTPATHSLSNVEKFPVFLKNSASSDNHHTPVQTYALSNTWSIYPLYYKNETQCADPKLSSPNPSNSSHNMESIKLGQQQSLCPVKVGALDFILPSNHECTSNEGHQIECDLTLRLGSLEVPCTGMQYSVPPPVENGNSSTLEGRKFQGHLKN